MALLGRSRRSRGSLPALVLVAPATGAAAGDTVSVAAGDTVSEGHDLPDVPAPQVGDPLDEAELQDLARFAEQRGITLEQAVADNAWRFDFSLLAAEFREVAPDAFTYAAATGPQTAELWLANRMPSEAETLVDNFSRHFPGIQLKVRSAVGWTETEITSALSAAHFAVFEQTGEAASEFNYQDLTIVVTIPKSDGEAAGDLANLAAEAAEEAVNRPLGELRLSVEVSDQEVLGGDNSPSYHRGGEVLTTCTSGPAFRHYSTGSRRGSTAGHGVATLLFPGRTQFTRRSTAGILRQADSVMGRMAMW